MTAPDDISVESLHPLVLDYHRDGLSVDGIVDKLLGAHPGEVADYMQARRRMFLRDYVGGVTRSLRGYLQRQARRRSVLEVVESRADGTWSIYQMPAPFHSGLTLGDMRAAELRQTASEYGTQEKQAGYYRALYAKVARRVARSGADATVADVYTEGQLEALFGQEDET